MIRWIIVRRTRFHVIKVFIGITERAMVISRSGWPFFVPDLAYAMSFPSLTAHITDNHLPLFTRRSHMSASKIYQQRPKEKGVTNGTATAPYYDPCGQ